MKRKRDTIGNGGGGGVGRKVGKKKKGRKAAAASAALAAQEEASLEEENPALARLARQQKVCVDRNRDGVECLISYTELQSVLRATDTRQGREAVMASRRGGFWEYIYIYFCHRMQLMLVRQGWDVNCDNFFLLPFISPNTSVQRQEICACPDGAP